MKDYEHQDASGVMAPGNENASSQSSAPGKQKNNTCGGFCFDPDHRGRLLFRIRMAVQRKQ